MFLFHNLDLGGIQSGLTLRYLFFNMFNCVNNRNIHNNITNNS